MKDQLDSSFADDSNVQVSKTGNALGIAVLVIGIVGFLWACIPYAGALACFVAFVGLVLGLVAFIRARAAGNPKRGAIIAGIILNVLALGISVFWIWKITVSAMDAAEQVRERLKDIDTSQIRKEVEKAMEELESKDSTTH